MANRRVERGPGHDELVGVGAALPVTAKGNVAHHVLSLQRDYGNAAVATLVQRKGGRSRAASTDNPGYKKGKKAPPKKPAVENLAPTESNPKFSSWSTSDLSTRARHEADSNVRNSLLFAAELYEEWWFRNPANSRGGALNLKRVYDKLGDAKRAKFWGLVLSGEFDPRKPVVEDMSDKYF